MALAYFITFTTYGTRLHGAEQGSVDQMHNVYETPLVQPDAERERRARETMKQEAYVLGPKEREITCQAMVQLARERGWHLWAAHVRSTHVHVVITAERDPGRLMSDLKARISRALTQAGFGDAQRRRWTRHGSTRHLFQEVQVEAAIRYTLDDQGERMAYYEEPRTQ